MAGKKEYFADGEQFTYNPDKAKELLKEAGYEPGEFEITMVYYEVDPLAVAGQKQYVKGMEEAGFKVKGIPVQVSPYDIWLDPDNKINKTLNLRGVNWCSDWPSGLTMVPPLTKTDAVYNTALFSEPAIDEEMSRPTPGAPWTRRSGPSSSRSSRPRSATTCTSSVRRSATRSVTVRSGPRTTRVSSSPPDRLPELID
jgi:ABC-type oligopeptide transport system substrate-binding subunit